MSDLKLLFQQKSIEVDEWNNEKFKNYKKPLAFTNSSINLITIKIKYLKKENFFEQLEILGLIDDIKE